MKAAPVAVFLASLMVATGSAVAAGTCTATSAGAMRPLVELYTSEGCDSCPPADRWLSSAFPVRDATASVLAFHVDYWDRLGWKDRFASADYTARQQAAMRTSGATFVYTPQVLIQGRDVAASRRAAALDAARAREPRATIAVEVDDGQVRARAAVADKAIRRNAALWIAYTDSGLVSDVKAGENRGVRLSHDHVVRALHGPFGIDAGGEGRATFALAPPAERGHDAALVAFVQDRATGEVLQTLTLRCGE